MLQIVRSCLSIPSSSSSVNNYRRILRVRKQKVVVFGDTLNCIAIVSIKFETHINYLMLLYVNEIHDILGQITQTGRSQFKRPSNGYLDSRYLFLSKSDKETEVHIHTQCGSLLNSIYRIYLYLYLYQSFFIGTFHICIRRSLVFCDAYKYI